MIWRMDEFDTDYSFLNLPEAGSAVRGPIELPSIEPIDFDLFGGTPPADDTGEDDTGEGDGGAEGSGIFQRQPIRERGNDQARFEMGRAIGQEVNTLRQNIQTLEAAKGELVSERDAAIQMQDQIRQQMSEQRIQELDQQQAQLQAELQEAVAAAEARGIDAVAEAEAQAAEELASVSADFQSQIDALTGERDAALAEQDVIRAEAADQQAQALEMQKQDYEAQLAALQQAPAETPAVPDIGPIPGMAEQFPYINLLGQEPSQEAKDAFARSMATGEAVISPDQVQEMINRMPVRDPIPPRDIIPPRPPQLPPKRKDQIFIQDRPNFISEERKIGKTIPDNLPGRAIPKPHVARLKPTPKNPADLIPIVGTGTGFIGGPVKVADTPFRGSGMAGAGARPDLPPPAQSALFGKRPTVRRPATPITPAPTITPPRRPMSVGGIGGISNRVNRMMMI